MINSQRQPQASDCYKFWYKIVDRVFRSIIRIKDKKNFGDHLVFSVINSYFSLIKIAIFGDQIKIFLQLFLEFINI